MGAVGLFADLDGDDGGLDDFPDVAEGGGKFVRLGEALANGFALLLGDGEALVEGIFIPEVTGDDRGAPEGDAGEL